MTISTDPTPDTAPPDGCDTERYMAMLSDYALPEAEKRAMIAALWHILDSLIRMEFGLDPIHDILAERAGNAGATTPDAVK